MAACPVDAEARRHYAESLWRRGARQEAIAQLEEAGRLAGEDASLWARLAEMHLANGQPELARQNAEQALDLDPKLPAAWAIRGGVTRAAGQPRQALADYLRALGYAPSDRAILLEIAELHRQLNQPERALQTLQTLADTYSPGEEPGQVLYLMGLAYVALGRYDDGVESLSAAVTRAKPTPEMFCRLGEAELLAGHPAEAADAARQALALQPQHQPSRELLATHRAGPAAARNGEEVGVESGEGRVEVWMVRRESWQCPQPIATSATPHSPLSPLRCFLLLNALALLLAAIWLRGHSLGNIPGVNGDEAWYGVQAWRMLHGGRRRLAHAHRQSAEPAVDRPAGAAAPLAAAFDRAAALGGGGRRTGGAGDQLAVAAAGCSTGGRPRFPPWCWPSCRSTSPTAASPGTPASRWRPRCRWSISRWRPCDFPSVSAGGSRPRSSPWRLPFGCIPTNIFAGAADRWPRAAARWIRKDCEARMTNDEDRRIRQSSFAIAPFRFVIRQSTSSLVLASRAGGLGLAAA